MPAFMYAPGWAELLIVGFIALLLFGKRLPGVMGSLGKSIVEFKRGVKGVEEDTGPPDGKSDSPQAPNV